MIMKIGISDDRWRGGVEVARVAPDGAILWRQHLPEAIQPMDAKRGGILPPYIFRASNSPRFLPPPWLRGCTGWPSIAGLCRRIRRVADLFAIWDTVGYNVTVAMEQ
jgi:hypothetical protein